MPDLTSALGLLDEMESSMESICPETGNVEDICPQQCEDLSLPMLDPASALGHLHTECFEAMSQLRLLHLGNVTFKGGYEHFPRTLRWLIWSPRDLESLPETLHLENIVVLDLSWSYITQLWGQQAPRGIKVFNKLKVLNLRECRSLTMCPDFRSMPHLEELDFEYCIKMSELHPSIGHLKSLGLLDLSHCESLKELPEAIGRLKILTNLFLRHCESLMELPQEICRLSSLETLDLENCNKISTLPSHLGDLKSLRKLYLDSTSITTLPESVGRMKQLNLLSLENCDSLKEVPECICSLLNLEELYAQGCISLASFPDSLGNLRRLRKLDLSGTDIEELSDSIVLLEKLELLSVARCGRLKFLPASASVGSMLLKSDGVSSASGDRENFRQSSVGVPSNRQDYSLLQFPSSLTELYATGCYELEMVADFSNAERMRELDLSGCQKLVDIPGVEQLKWLSSLKLAGCRSISDSLRKRLEDANFERLTDFSISGFLNAAESSGAPRLLTFSFLPKRFKSGSLYLKLSETGHDSVLGGIGIARFTTADGCELLFKTSFQGKVWRRFDDSGRVPIVKLGEYGKMMMNGGGFVGNDGHSRSRMVMCVIIDGCLLLDGYLRSTTNDDACGDIAFDSCDITSIANIRVNFGGPLHYYEGPATVLSIDFS